MEDVTTKHSKKKKFKGNDGYSGGKWGHVFQHFSFLMDFFSGANKKPKKGSGADAGKKKHKHKRKKQKQNPKDKNKKKAEKAEDKDGEFVTLSLR